jgi:hypothetical protein
MEVVRVSAIISQINLDRDDVFILNAALNEILNGIEVFEFETRIGNDKDRVAVLHRAITALLDEMDSSKI